MSNINKEKMQTSIVNWYPGHMTKAKRMMEENIKIIDLVIEIVDARIPLSSRNPDIDKLAKNKSRMVLLNKSDLSDGQYNKEWIKYFENQGIIVCEINSKSGYGIKNIHNLVKEACREKIERDKKRGIVNRPVRAMVVGIPNVGKSTFINALVGKSAAKTGNKPGVTKGKQWISVNKSFELLDTPGILWPKFEDKIVGMNLAFIGSINDEIIVIEDLAYDLINVLKEYYPNVIPKRYEIDEEADAFKTLELIAENRKCYLKGENYDLKKAAALLIDDFRSGRLGKITLERPNMEETENE